MKASMRMGVGVLAMILGATCGCQQAPQTAGRSVAADGGLATECEGPGLLANVVVTVYHADGSRYLTEQQHRLCPTAAQLVITADEPSGPCAWQLREGQFSAVRTVPNAESLCSAATAQAILSLFAVSGGFVATPTGTGAAVERIDGQSYEAIDAALVPALVVPEGFSVTLLRPVGQDRVDRVRVVDARKRSILAHAFNFERAVEMDRILPTRIEIRLSGSGPARLDLEYVDFSAMGRRTR